MERVDVVILGAGAAGMFAAIEAGRRGRSVLVVDHAPAPGEKIRISGGGRCNFTNLDAGPEHFLSANPRFCISALKRYTQHDFIRLVERHGIAYHEKTRGQLFCDGSSRQIVDMLLAECRSAKVRLQMQSTVDEVTREDGGFRLTVTDRREGRAIAEEWRCASLVVATGGLSIPKMGATGFGHELARRFGIKVTPRRAALVPLTFDAETLAELKDLSGVSVNAAVRCGTAREEEALLFTHRGLSGPVILQISSHWREGEEIAIDMAPGTDVLAFLRDARERRGKQALRTVLADLLPKRLAQRIAEKARADRPLAELGDKQLRRVAAVINDWRVTPKGSEGFRTAEVTLGGVDTDELSSKTMESRKVPGLYFIGEVVDVTGRLGGFNFQWAWSSGHAAGQAI